MEEEMSRGFWQKIDADHGDLADVVRHSAGKRALDLATLPPPQESNCDFGDPFSTFRDPLLRDLNGGGTFFGEANTAGDCGEDFSKALQISSAIKSAAPLASASAAILCGNIGSSPLDHGELQISSPSSPDMKRRKSQTKKVVCIPAPAASSSRPGGDVIPPDLWAWRKYGQKPIKGSPYPRGYYKCSSSKGCSARKQVERSRSDPSMLVITYTSEHNHPWPTQKSSLAGSSRSQVVRSGGASISGGFTLNQEAATAAESLFTGLRELGLAGEDRRGRPGAPPDRLAMFNLRGNPFWEANWGL